jgi:hypothetical protein
MILLNEIIQKYIIAFHSQRAVNHLSYCVSGLSSDIEVEIKTEELYLLGYNTV